MRTNQCQAALPHAFSPPHCHLPEVTSHREKNSALSFGPFQNFLIAGARKVLARPQNVVAGATQVLNDPARKILICEQQHLRRERIRPELMRKVTRIRKTRE